MARSLRTSLCSSEDLKWQHLIPTAVITKHDRFPEIPRSKEMLLILLNLLSFDGWHERNLVESMFNSAHLNLLLLRGRLLFSYMLFAISVREVNLESA